MKKTTFYFKQTLHNMISISSAAIAILAMGGWIESGYYFRAAGALLYFIIWILAQETPASDGRRHNKSYFD